MQIAKLDDNLTKISAFDCGDADLNDFILNEAKAYRQSEPNEITKTMYFDILQIQ